MFLEKLFSNSGKKIKIFALISYIVTVGLEALVGTYFFALFTFDSRNGFLWMMITPLVTGIIAIVAAGVSWLPCMLLYGFGELIENSGKSDKEKEEAKIRFNQNTNKAKATHAPNNLAHTQKTSNGTFSYRIDRCEMCKRNDVPVFQCNFGPDDPRPHNLCNACKSKMESEMQTQKNVRSNTNVSYNTSTPYSTNQSSVNTPKKPQGERVRTSPIPAKDSKLADKLNFALKYVSDKGMIAYLEGIDDDEVKNILKLPANQIRSEIQKLESLTKSKSN